MLGNDDLWRRSLGFVRWSKHNNNNNNIAAHTTLIGRHQSKQTKKIEPSMEHHGHNYRNGQVKWRVTKVNSGKLTRTNAKALQTPWNTQKRQWKTSANHRTLRTHGSTLDEQGGVGCSMRQWWFWRWKSYKLRIFPPPVSLLFLIKSSKEKYPGSSGSSLLPFPWCFLFKVIRKSLLGAPDPASSLFLTVSY